MPNDAIRVLIVDDSALYRQLLRNVLRDIADVEVVGTASSGQEALARVGPLAADLLTLDVRMPGGDGIEVLRELKRLRSPARAIMVSSLTASGAQVTTDALLEGAFDFILKPAGPDAEANRAALRSALREKISAFRDNLSGRDRHAAPVSPGPLDRAAPLVSSSAAESVDWADDVLPTECQAVLIGTSTGGPVALREILPQLPGDLAVPVLIVQHMPAQYTHSLAERLNQGSQLEVVEACDGMTLEPGFAFVAPGGRHMKIAVRNGRNVIRITDDPPENSCRPSVDYLFRAAAEVFEGKVVAVILTGMGRDGTEGCRELKRKGAFVIAQHPDGCIVYGMPKSVVEERLADRVVPLESIARVVAGLVRAATVREKRG